MNYKNLKFSDVIYLIILFMICFISCEKEYLDIKLEEQSEITIIQEDTFSIKTGRYSGEMWMWLPDRDTIEMTSYREIYRDNKGYLIMRWWSFPDTTSKMKDIDTLNYKMVYDNTNTSCGKQRKIYTYKVKSYMSRDSLIENGTVNHKFYYEDRLIKNIDGTFKSKSKYVDRLTPQKPK